MQKLDLTPTWEEALPAYLLVLENGDEEGKKIVRKELRNMAKAADAYNKSLKKNKKGK